jgi:signal peptidase I
MRNPKGLLTELVEVAALALGLYLVITFAIETVHVDGLSMYPTVHNADYLVALKLPYRFHNPSRGDIVIMKDPYDPSRDFIKRVIGLPGETILIRNAHVYIDGRLLVEPYLAKNDPWTLDDNWPVDGKPYKLGPNQYFVMGDNRNNSTDSRIFGPIPRSSIEAEAWLRVLPFNRFGFVDPVRPYLLPKKAMAPAA